jgi:hypothetical protein
MKRSIVLVIALALSLPATAGAKQLKVDKITSNSVLTDAEKGIVYGPELVLDDELGTMWIEGEGSAGLGKYIEVVFPEEVELAKIRIWGGCFIDKEFFDRHNRVAQLEAKYPDFSSEKFEVKDEMNAQWLELAEPKKLTKVKIYLRRVYDGNTWNDTAITKMEFFDKAGPESRVEGLTATASSFYDSDAAYDPKLAVDGWTDTHWVEGVEGDGDGEWIDVDLGGSKTLTRFEISTGWDQTESFFNGNNRAGKVTLSFSNGSSQSFDLADERGIQSFDLDSVTASKVKVTFGKIRKGATNNDLYVGELRFFE